MQPDEARAVGRLAGESAHALTRQVHGVHAALAGRVWSALGPLGAPVRLAHDAITRGVYDAVGVSLEATLRTASQAAALALSPQGPALADGPTARRALALVNGAVGDALEHQGSALATPLTLRVDSRPVSPDRSALLAALPAATSKAVVFVHGFGQTEDAWSGRRPSYGAQLAAELGYTPLYVRYNTGRSAAETGRELAGLLERLHREWPAHDGLRSLALVGHDLGGLVARHAIAAGAEQPWARAVHHLITLGTPHAGSGAGKAVARTAGLLARLPETRPLAGLLEARSAGAKDLGRGSDAPFAPHVRHLLISAGPVRIGHFGLLNHPVVYRRIWAELRGAPPLPEPGRRFGRRPGYRP